MSLVPYIPSMSFIPSKNQLRKAGIKPVRTNATRGRSARLNRRVRNLENVTNAFRPIRTFAPRFGNRGGRRRVNQRQDRPGEATITCRETYPKTLSPGLNVIRVRPGDSNFNFLDGLSVLFRNYRFEKCKDFRVTYKPTVASTVNGQVIMAIDYHDTLTVKSRDDLSALQDSTTTSAFQPSTIRVRNELAMKNRPWQAFTSRARSVAQGSEMLQTAFTVFIWLEVADAPDVSLGSLEFAYKIRVGAMAARDDLEPNPTPNVQVPQFPAIGGPVNKQTPSVAIDDQDDTLPEGEKTAVVNSEQVLDQNIPGSIPEPAGTHVTSIQLPKAEVGDHISVLQTDQVASLISTARKYGHISGNNLADGFKISQPKVNFRWSDGTPIPESVITPLGKTPKIAGGMDLKSKHFGLPDVTHLDDLTQLDGSDIFSSLFKVAAPLVNTFLPEAAPIVDIFGSLLSGPTRNTASGIVKNELHYSITPHGGATNATEEETTLPQITAAAIGDELDLTIQQPPLTNMWDHAMFGCHFTVGKQGIIVPATDANPRVNFDGDYSVDYDSGNDGLVRFWVNDSVETTPFTLGEIITAHATISAKTTAEGESTQYTCCWPDNEVVGLQLRAASFASTSSKKVNANAAQNGCCNVYTVTPYALDIKGVCFGYKTFHLLFPSADEVDVSIHIARTSLVAQAPADVPAPPQDKATTDGLAGVLRRRR